MVTGAKTGKSVERTGKFSSLFSSTGQTVSQLNALHAFNLKIYLPLLRCDVAVETDAVGTSLPYNQGIRGREWMADKQPRKRKKRASHTIDLGEELEAKILSYQSDFGWQELPIAGKVRALLRSVLATEPQEREQKVAALVNFVKCLTLRQRPTEPDIIIAANLMDVDPADLEEVAERCLTDQPEE